MSKPNRKGDGYLTDSIRKYGFAASIEVSNRLKGKEKKSKQARFAKEYLLAVTEGADIEAGVAFNGNRTESPYSDDNGIDFIIEINRYDEDRLEKVAEEMLYSKHMSCNDRKMMERVLNERCSKTPITAFFENSIDDLCAERLGMKLSDYQSSMSNIHGLGVELYIKSSLEDYIPSGLVLHRHKFSHKSEEEDYVKTSDIDDLVICGQDEFYDAMDRMDRDRDFTTWILYG